MLKNFSWCYSLLKLSFLKMDYKKKTLDKISFNSTYEEIDTRLASGWYVDSVGTNKKKKYKTKEVSFKISKKQINWIPYLSFNLNLDVQIKKLSHLVKKVSVDTWFCIPIYIILRCTLNFVWGNLWSFSKACL